MTYLQAIVIALVQGVTELFPVSSLGHSVLVPGWIGGSWQNLVTQSSSGDSATSFYLAFIVALHVATALALLWFFREDWVRIIGGFLRSAKRSAQARSLSIEGSDERLAWLIVLASIPVGIFGLALEHTFRTIFAKPLAAAIFLFINGLILLAGDHLRRATLAHPGAGGHRSAGAVALASPGGRSDRVAPDGRGARQSAEPGDRPPIGGAAPDDDSTPAERAAARARARSARTGLGADGPAGGTGGRPGGGRDPGGRDRGGRSSHDVADAREADRRLARMPMRDALYIGGLQVAALFAGISRSGITMTGGLWRGLDYEHSARFAFLLATPPILAAGLLKIPSLFGSAGAHIHGQVAVGFIICGVTAYFSVRFLLRYFETRTLRPFGIYCLIAGFASIIRFAVG